MARGLTAKGIDVGAVERFRDSGWQVEAFVEGIRVVCWLSPAGPMAPGEYLLGCACEPGWLSKIFFAKRGQSVERRVAQVIHNVLGGTAQVSRIRWYRDFSGDFEAPWAESPVDVTEHSVAALDAFDDVTHSGGHALPR
jgi:hypothetical protein